MTDPGKEIERYLAWQIRVKRSRGPGMADPGKEIERYLPWQILVKRSTGTCHGRYW
jgi:hypothetical protein